MSARLMARARSNNNKTNSAANIGFEAKLWLAADKLRSNMDAAEYKHVVLGLIFLKYISDSFEEHHAKLLAGEGEYAGANPEDPDEYRAENIFWVPPAARWTHLQNNAKQPAIGKIVDDAMVAIERDNPRLKGILPKDYARPALDKNRLGELIDLIGTINLVGSPEQKAAGKSHRSVDLLGRVYEYFLSQFASAEGKKGGQFYTPQSVVRLLVEMLAPYKGRIYDPCCGSGGMFVQSEKFVEAHGGKLGAISIPISAPTSSSPIRPSTTPTGSAKTTTRAGSSAFPRAATPTSPGCSTSSITSRQVDPELPPAWPASSSPMAACPLIKAAKAKSAAPSSKLTSSIAWSPFPASSFIQLKSRSAFGSFRKIRTGECLNMARTYQPASANVG